MTRHLPSSVLFVNIIFRASIHFWSFSTGSSTDIEFLSPLTDTSLGHEVQIPVLDCHSKITGYHTVTWYKDGMVVQNGSASMSGHVLSIRTLLDKPFPNVLNSLLKLQGYYWCDIDLNFATKTPQKFLFEIPNVHTYVGSLLAENDKLDNSTERSLEDNISIMRAYENDLENNLFAFLPLPNTFVTHINQTEEGVVVNFFLYAQWAFNPRHHDAYTLGEDEDQLQYIYDYLNNRTSTVDEYLTHQRNWTQKHGVSISDIKLTSTAGCFRDITGSSEDKQLTWPYSLLNEVIVSEQGCMTHDKLAVTRVCSGSFTSGAAWGPVEGVCAEFPQNRSAELMNLLKHETGAGRSEDIKKLQILTDKPKDLNVLDLHLATAILEELSLVPLSPSEIDDIFTVIDNVMKTDVYSLDAAKGTLRLSARILNAIDRTTSFDHNKELTVTKSEIVVAAQGTNTSKDLIVGASILPSAQWFSSSDSPVTFVSNGSDVTASQSVAGFTLPSDLILQREREKDLTAPCQVNMVYFSDWRLFSDPKEVMRHRNYEAVPTPVIHVGLSGGPAWNLTNPIRFYFRNDFKTDLNEQPLCSYFDRKLNDGFGGWATEGCSMEGLHNGYYVCHCHHIAMLSIVVPRRPRYLFFFRPSPAVFIGCGISIAILCLVVIFYLSSKKWRTSVNHHIFFFLSVAMLCSLILLLVHNVESKWGPGCMFLTIVFHYFVQVTFCWVLVQSLVHHSRFCKNVEISDMGKFLTRANVFAWDLPFLTVGITWVVKGSEYYNHKVCWSTMQEISNIIFYPVILLFLLTLCFNAIAVYCTVCGFTKDLEMKSKKHDELVSKFKISLSIFILFLLCWIFGYLALHKKPKELQILFGISVTVTSLYIYLFFVFHDISPKDVYAKISYKKTKIGSSADPIASDDTKTYNSTN